MQILVIFLLPASILATAMDTAPKPRQVELVIHYQQDSKDQEYKEVCSVTADSASAPTASCLPIKNIKNPLKLPICHPNTQKIVEDYLQVAEGEKMELKTKTVTVLNLATGIASPVIVCESDDQADIIKRFDPKSEYDVVEGGDGGEMIHLVPQGYKLSELTIFDPIQSRELPVKVATSEGQDAHHLKQALSNLTQIPTGLIVLCGDKPQELVEFVGNVILPSYVVVEYEGKMFRVPTCQHSAALFCRDTKPSDDECDAKLIKRLLLLVPGLKGKQFSLCVFNGGSINERMGEFDEDPVRVVLNGAVDVAEDPCDGKEKKKQKLKRNKKVTIRSIIGMAVIAALHVAVIGVVVWCLCSDDAC